MPTKKTIKKAQADKRAGKSPSTQASEFVDAEIKEIRKGKHGAKNAKQAIAIGLSEARRAGVNIPDKKGKKAGKKKISKKNVSAKRSKAATARLKKLPIQAASHKALSTQAKKVARKKKKASGSKRA